MASIEKRVTADGRVRWTMRVFIGRDENGKRKFVIRTFDRKKDAEAEARRLERIKDQGGLVTASAKEPLAKYMARWLDVKAGQVRARTIHDYRAVVRRWIEDPPEGAPPIGAIALNRLTPDAFEELYTWMRDQGRAPRTIQKVHVIVRQALGDAVRKQALASNPTDYAQLPKRSKDGDELGEKKAVRAMDEDQAARFLEAARADRYSALWHVLLLGGLRPSEALGLGWEHVDFEAGRIHVTRSLTRVGVDGWRLVPTKTKKSRRQVPLPRVAIDELRAWRAQQARERLLAGAEYEDNDLVFTTPFGKPLDLSNLHAYNFRRVMAAAGVGEWGPEPPKPRRGPRRARPFKPAFRIYDLRHTCATLLLKAGVSAKIVQERLGHASITLTLDTYSHVLPDMQESAADALDAMFSTAARGGSRG